MKVRWVIEVTGRKQQIWKFRKLEEREGKRFLDATCLYQYTVKDNMSKGRNGPKDLLLIKKFPLNKISSSNLSISVLMIIDSIIMQILMSQLLQRTCCEPGTMDIDKDQEFEAYINFENTSSEIPWSKHQDFLLIA